MNENDDIEVFCLVCPNGVVYWADSYDDIKEIVPKWREKHPEFVRKPLCGGLVRLVMPRETYRNIPATADFS